jgi:small subunit ribosomal protein S21|tara:strand:+ start:384 stop:590 length:207 start_codon:yes stop_codon:yes gene_type:complete
LIEVIVKNNNIDKALRILKRKIKEDRLFVTLREREYYRKPSDIKREKKAKARLRNKYKVEKENNSYGL